ncbi:helix-turn-helix domain-containing protein [Serratia marcescens]|uniref:helix-turn-helix domain-containing protein n=1 Tax=Serratia marcescens TaxID=615 RepID=UPI0039893A65
MYRDVLVTELVKWINNNLEEELNINIVAQKSGYSKWHLQRLFKRLTGVTIARYIRWRRLNNAAALLKISNAPILDIALKYHFDSQASFTRAFKRQFSKTPFEYRRMEISEHNGYY